MNDWRKELDSLFRENEAGAKDDAVKIAKSRKAAEEFCASQVVPAFEELKEALEKHGRNVKVSPGPPIASLLVKHKGEMELDYVIQVKVYADRAFPVPETRFYSGEKFYSTEGALKNGSQDYTVADITKQDIITHFLMEYKKHVHSKD